MTQPTAVRGKRWSEVKVLRAVDRMYALWQAASLRRAQAAWGWPAGARDRARRSLAAGTEDRWGNPEVWALSAEEWRRMASGGADAPLASAGG